MKTIRAHWRRYVCTTLAVVGALAYFSPLAHGAQLAAVCLAWGWVLSPRGQVLKSNQAVVTAPKEPSSDARQFARSVTDIRQALINEGMTPEQAARTLRDIFEANAKGQQS